LNIILPFWKKRIICFAFQLVYAQLIFNFFFFKECEKKICKDSKGIALFENYRIISINKSRFCKEKNIAEEKWLSLLIRTFANIEDTKN
jgi:hypothetical protein